MNTTELHIWRGEQNSQQKKEIGKIKLIHTVQTDSHTVI